MTDNYIGSRTLLVDYLRGGAALAVTWYHVTRPFAETSSVGDLGAFGYLGVEVFFVISGFIIPWSIKGWKNFRIDSYRAFLLRRTLRVEIPYIASIFFSVMIWWLASLAPGFRGEPPEVSAIQFFLHVTYLIPFTSYDWWNGVYWTLAYEFAFYVGIGLLFAPLLSSSKRMAILCCCTLLFLGLIVFGLLPIYWALFVMGVYVFRYKMGFINLAGLMMVLVMSGASMVFSAPSFTSTLQALAGIATSILIVFFSHSFSGNSRLEKVLSWFGAISYSLYLTHPVIGNRVVNLGKRFVGGDFYSELSLGLLATVISIVFAWLFYVCIERPSHEYARSINLTVQKHNSA